MPHPSPTALDLPLPDPLPEEVAALFARCQEKLGLVPNVLVAYAHRPEKLAAFTAMYNDLMLGESGLTKLEREMIAVAVSAENRCWYCLVAHGAAVRLLSGDPALGEAMAFNHRYADLTARQSAMIDFARDDDARERRDRGGGPRGAARARALGSGYLGRRGGGGLLQHVKPDRERDRHGAEPRLSCTGALSRAVADVVEKTLSRPTCGVGNRTDAVLGSTRRRSAA